MKLCLIEDDLLLGRALGAALQDAGHQVTWLRLASEARARLSGEHEFDAAILDLGLPDGEGIELLRGLRRAEQSLPVVIVTARESLAERIDGLDAGADDFLVKPFANAELLARLRAVTRRGARPGASVDSLVCARNLTLDEQRMTIRRDGEVLSLSPTEFALLRHLLRHKNRVRTRRQLEESAMRDGGGQSLDVHISNLRRKVGPDAIRTVRGVGYLIEDAPTQSGTQP